MPLVVTLRTADESGGGVPDLWGVLYVAEGVDGNLSEGSAVWGAAAAAALVQEPVA